MKDSLWTSGFKAYTEADISAAKGSVIASHGYSWEGDNTGIFTVQSCLLVWESNPSTGLVAIPVAFSYQYILQAMYSNLNIAALLIAARLSLSLSWLEPSWRDQVCDDPQRPIQSSQQNYHFREPGIFKLMFDSWSETLTEYQVTVSVWIQHLH